MGLGIAAIAAVPTAMADINPWIRQNLYSPGKWDTAGPGTATPWLHPPIWSPGQGWGLLGGEVEANNVTGSWGGWRDELVARGLALEAAYFGQFAANPIGGESQGASWRGGLALGAFADLDRLFDVERTYFTMSFTYNDGTSSLTPTHVGNEFPVQLSSATDNRYTRLVHLAVGTQLFDNTVALNGGRIVAGEQFANLAQACNSVNQAICGNPIVAPRNITFPTYPNAVWGMNFEYKPDFAWYAKTGAYAVESDLLDDTNGGTNFGLPDGAGPLVLAELGYLFGRTPARGPEGGLTPASLVSSGTYKVGAYYDGEQLTNLSTGDTQRHTWGVYAMGEQQLYRERTNSDDGVWAWLALSYAPPDVNRVQFMAAGGVSYNGLIDGRPDDTISLIVANGHFSDRLPDQSSETLIEADLRIQALPSVYIEPNLQYIINPDGRSTIDSALVTGIALGVNF
ncbi:MAG: carbohydrate porin [Pseudomonadota bacterium]